MRRKKIIYFLVLALGAFLWWWTDPTPLAMGTVKIYDRKGELLYESAGGVGRKEFVAYDQMPEELKKAVVAAEDERFWQHRGVDFISVLRAVRDNVRAGKVVSGASTIPQQVVRFTKISPYKPAPMSLSRKAREMAMAFRLSLTTPKEKILEQYLNTMHFGRETYGVAAAARLYFGSSIAQLSWGQSALLAGMIANPSLYDPINHPVAAVERRKAVLEALENEGMIGSEVRVRAEGEALPVEVEEEEMVSPHLVGMVKAELERLGMGKHEGISVYTSTDKHWYEYLLLVARRQIAEVGQKNNVSNAAAVIVENETGRILAVLGGIDYFNERIGGQNNMAVALRQPGSALKPITYALAIENRMATPATLIHDVPKVYSTKKGPGFMPHNYDGRYRGSVLLRDALASSYNLPAVEVLSWVGIEPFLNLVHQMGVTSMKEVERYDLALTLGGGEISLLELTNVYATFSRGGEYLPTQLIDRVVTDEGKEIFRAVPVAPRQVLSSQTAYLIGNILADSKARIPTFGEKNYLSLSVPAAVKTGTTTDWHDNWTVGYTPTYTMGVWVGNADNEQMRDISGVTGAAPIWQAVMEKLAVSAKNKEFVQPEGIEIKEVCSWDGKLPNSFCNERYREVFVAGTVPTEITSLSAKPVYVAGEAEQWMVVSPRSGGVYEGDENEQGVMTFEVSPASEVEAVEWRLNGLKALCEPVGVGSCAWKMIPGRHQLAAVVKRANGGEFTTETVQFEVVPFRAKYSQDSGSF